MRVAATLVSAFLLASCGGNSNEGSTSVTAPTDAGDAAQPSVLHVYNWSDYIAEDTLERFTAETGIQVVYEEYADNDTLESKLASGGSGYDVVFPSARPYAYRLLQGGHFAPLDKSLLPNISNLDSALLSGLTDIDPGNAHVLPYLWGTTGIAYNVDKVREALGPNADINSWSLIFDTITSAKLAECGIAMLDDAQEGFGAALLFAGANPNAVSAGEIALVEDTFANIRPHIRYFDSNRYIDDLASGAICVAMGYNGDALQAMDRAQEAGNGMNLGFVIPREGAVRWMDVMAIPADAPNKAGAHAFINFLMRPEVIAAVTDYVGYPNANAASIPLISETVRNDPAVYPSATVATRLADPRLMSSTDAEARRLAWDRITADR